MMYDPNDPALKGSIPRPNEQKSSKTLVFLRNTSLFITGLFSILIMVTLCLACVYAIKWLWMHI
jgi:hypothetical protein